MYINPKNISFSKRDCIIMCNANTRAERRKSRWKINFPRVFAIVQRWPVIFDGL